MTKLELETVLMPESIQTAAVWRYHLIYSIYLIALDLYKPSVGVEMPKACGKCKGVGWRSGNK